jgi:NADH-quinone oxidoreductase subunit J
MLATFLFFLFAVMAIAAALGMLISRSPVASALWMVLNLFSIAVLYLTLHAQFIAIVQVLVYAGAIMVLFLFVIMLLNLDVTPTLARLDWRKGIAFLLGVAVLAQLLLAVALGLDLVPEPVPAEVAAANADAGGIGMVLFSEYGYLLQIIAVLLLAATVGAVLLAQKHRS